MSKPFDGCCNQRLGNGCTCPCHDPASPRTAESRETLRAALRDHGWYVADVATTAHVESLEWTPVILAALDPQGDDTGYAINAAQEQIGRVRAALAGARPAPHELWEQAGGDRDRYLALMREHGHIVQGTREPGTDIFGHSIRDVALPDDGREAAVRRSWPRWECAACHQNANQCYLARGCCINCDHADAALVPADKPGSKLETAAIEAGTHEPAVDDFGNQYLSPVATPADTARLPARSPTSPARASRPAASRLRSADEGLPQPPPASEPPQ